VQEVLSFAEIRQKWRVQVFLNMVSEDEALRLFHEQGAG
jgi:hypothetical protein